MEYKLKTFHHLPINSASERTFRSEFSHEKPHTRRVLGARNGTFGKQTIVFIFLAAKITSARVFVFVVVCCENEKEKAKKIRRKRFQAETLPHP